MLQVCTRGDRQFQVHVFKKLTWSIKYLLLVKWPTYASYTLKKKKTPEAGSSAEDAAHRKMTKYQASILLIQTLTYDTLGPRSLENSYH